MTRSKPKKLELDRGDVTVPSNINNNNNNNRILFLDQDNNDSEIGGNKDDQYHIFFDTEAMQVNGRHVPNLLVAETEQSNDSLIFQGTTWVEDFVNWLDSPDDDSDSKNNGDEPNHHSKNKSTITVIAHNFQGYDSYPIISCYSAQKRQIEQIRNGDKVLQLQVGRIRFIDSLSFFNIPLSSFPKTFGLTELRKGFFPHFFNTPEHQNYVGPLPDRQMYNPDDFYTKMREEFDRWYEQQLERQRTTDYQFNLQEFVAYCCSDVRLLEEGCLCFMSDFQDLARFNPFGKITIAAACSWDLRRNRLEPNTIASEPLTGWRRSTNHSKIAIGWLLWEQHQQGIQIQHTRNEGEYIVPGTRYTVDGFHAPSRTIYEFYGFFIMAVLTATTTATLPKKKPPQPHYGRCL